MLMIRVNDTFHPLSKSFLYIKKRFFNIHISTAVLFVVVRPLRCRASQQEFSGRGRRGFMWDDESLLKRGCSHHMWVSLISAITWLAFCNAWVQTVTGSVLKTYLMTYWAMHHRRLSLSLQPLVTLDKCVTLSMSAASLRLWAMSSDSVNRSFSRAVLYNWPTSSLCRQSFTWLTRKCITAFGTLRKEEDSQSDENRVKTSNLTCWCGVCAPVLDVFPDDQKVWLDESLDDLTVPLLPSRQLPGHWNGLAVKTRYWLCLLINRLTREEADQTQPRRFCVPTTSSRLTAWPFCGLEGKGGGAVALSPAAPSSPFFNMPLQPPIPPSVCSLTELPAAA